MRADDVQTLTNGQQSLLDPLHNLADSDGPISPRTTLFSQRQAAQTLFSRPQQDSIDTRNQYASNWQPSGFTSGGSFGYGDGRGYNSRHNSSTLADDNAFTLDHEREDGFLSVPRAGKRYYERDEQRTIVARNLHERTTHKDIVDCLRGGTVLDIYLRANDRSANISFVEGQHAQNFMKYIKRNDIYIHDKRVSGRGIHSRPFADKWKVAWAWNDRKFILPGHVANKINSGATRNLVIRKCPPIITEEKLREDLDHIHNCVIIDITYANGGKLPLQL